MKIDIFSSEHSDSKVAVRRHLLTLLTAILVNLVFWFFQSLGMPVEGEEDGSLTILLDILISSVETIVLMEASFAACRLVIRLFWNREFSFAYLLIQNILLLLSVVLIAFGISTVYSFLFPYAKELAWDVFLCDCIIAFFLTSFFFSSFLMNKYRQEKSLAQQIIIDKLKLKTDNHFVFNSLATLGSLIQTNPEAAMEFNSSMSRMYRYIVSKGDVRLVSLSDEISFMDEYRKNMAVRHSEVDICIDSELSSFDTMIPPLTLQELVDNALKHNSHTSSDKLTIHIGLNPDADMIIVQNNRQPLKRTIETSGTGLNTLNQRYQLICGQGILIEDIQDRFSVSLPVIRE